jgi:hypothetical protein
MPKVQQFSISQEFDDITPILQEWSKGPNPGLKPVYGGRQESMSKTICMALRMYAENTKEYFALMHKEGERTEEEEQRLNQMMAQRRKLFMRPKPGDV